MSSLEGGRLEENRRFTHINELFTCHYCGQNVLPLKTGCRNHCPSCLSSQHVDDYPGDRANSCHGQLSAYSYSINSKKGLVLHFVCERCGKEGNNKAACDDPLQPDDYQKILSLGCQGERKKKRTTTRF
ncbi:MAG: RNHCP domain-containing protein [Deltaproteobacteria bacterium]|nr:RNHCP domain-containing protein [Deltaproteobacteria bacterium]